MNEEAEPPVPAVPTIPPSSITDRERLDYAWKHFALIADQRIKTFNFYIILLAGSFTGTVAALTRDGIHRHTFCLIGTAHIITAIIFALIDWRGCRMLRIASDALVEIERSSAFAGHRVLIQEDRARNKRGLWHLVSYRWAFLAAFSAQIAFGVLLAWKPQLLARPLSRPPPAQSPAESQPQSGLRQ